jgi:hypothetical protein
MVNFGLKEKTLAESSAQSAKLGGYRGLPEGFSDRVSQNYCRFNSKKTGTCTFTRTFLYGSGDLGEPPGGGGGGETLLHLLSLRL